MKRPWVWLVVALNLVALIALVFLYPHLMVSPGAVMTAHQELATDCFACVTGRESPSCGEVCSSLRRLAIHS